MEIVEFLTACLDEDERIARAATGGPWAWTPETDVWDQNGPTLIREGTDAPGIELVEVAAGWGHDAWGIHISDEDKAHIAAHDPARVLREIDAKRQMLSRYEELRAASKEQGLIGDVTEEYQDFLLRLLALPYTDRPGFREEWRL